MFSNSHKKRLWELWDGRRTNSQARVCEISMHKLIKMIINVDWNKNGAWMSHYTTRKLGHNPKYALPIGVIVIFALVLNFPYIGSWYAILFVLVCCSSCVATLIFSHCYVALLVLLCCFFSHCFCCSSHVGILFVPVLPIPS